jgi:hypothetical protein
VFPTQAHEPDHPLDEHLRRRVEGVVRSCSKRGKGPWRRRYNYASGFTLKGSCSYVRP